MAGDVDVDRVLHRPRGMVRWDVQRVEVVPLVLDLRTLDDAIAETEEDVDDLVLRRARADAATPARARLPGSERSTRSATRSASSASASSSARRASAAPCRSERASFTRCPTVASRLAGERSDRPLDLRQRAPSARRPAPAPPPARRAMWRLPRASMPAPAHPRGSGPSSLDAFIGAFCGASMRSAESTARADCGTGDGELDAERQPSLVEVTPGTPALGLRHASRHVQPDLGPAARPGPAGREQRVDVDVAVGRARGPHDAGARPRGSRCRPGSARRSPTTRAPP